MCRTELSKTKCDPWPGQHEPNGGIKNYPPKPTKPFHFIGGRTSPVSAPIRARSHYYTVSLALPQVHSSWTESSPRKSNQHQHLLWYVHLGNSLHLRVKEPSIYSWKCWRPGNCKTDITVSILMKYTTSKQLQIPSKNCILHTNLTRRRKEKESKRKLTKTALPPQDQEIQKKNQ